MRRVCLVAKTLVGGWGGNPDRTMDAIGPQAREIKTSWSWGQKIVESGVYEEGMGSSRFVLRTWKSHHRIWHREIEMIPLLTDVSLNSGGLIEGNKRCDTCTVCQGMGRIIKPRKNLLEPAAMRREAVTILYPSGSNWHMGRHT